MTNSTRNAKKGRQEPRVSYAPPSVSSTGQEAIELAALAGLELDPWQQYVLGAALGERKDGTWAAKEVGLCLSRQNGKGSILEARELAGLFLLDEPLIVHSAELWLAALGERGLSVAWFEDLPEFFAVTEAQRYVPATPTQHLSVSDDWVTETERARVLLEDGKPGQAHAILEKMRTAREVAEAEEGESNG